jgi:hypothetical protein
MVANNYLFRVIEEIVPYKRRLISLFQMRTTNKNLKEKTSRFRLSHYHLEKPVSNDKQWEFIVSLFSKDIYNHKTPSLDVFKENLTHIYMYKCTTTTEYILKKCYTIVLIISIRILIVLVKKVCYREYICTCKMYLLVNRKKKKICSLCFLLKSLALDVVS